MRRTLWGIRPDVLTTIVGWLRHEPTPALCDALGPILGNTPKPSELLATLRGEVEGGSGSLSAECQAKLARAAGANVAGGVAVIPLRGLITPRASLMSLIFGGSSGGLEGLQAALHSALANDDVGSIVIDIDSPGGRIDLVPETAAAIREATKPTVAIANTDAASAAYWLASQADELIITPSGQVGSIGVFAMHEDWSKYDEQLGVATTLISAGRFKTEANPFEPLSDEAREAIQVDVDAIYSMFVSDVVKGRGASAKTVREGFGEGRMVLAKDALDEGMADRIDTFEGVIARLAGDGKTDKTRSARLEIERAETRALQLARPRH